MIVALLVTSIVAILARLIAVYLLRLRHASREGGRWVDTQLVKGIVLTARNCLVDESGLSVDGERFTRIARVAVASRLVPRHTGSRVAVLP